MVIVTLIVDPAVQNPILSNNVSIDVGTGAGPFSVYPSAELIVTGKVEAYDVEGTWVFPDLKGILTFPNGRLLASATEDPLPQTAIEGSPSTKTWTATFEPADVLMGCSRQLIVSEQNGEYDSKAWTIHFDLDLGTCSEPELARKKAKGPSKAVADVRKSMDSIELCELIDITILKPFDDVDLKVKPGDPLQIVTNFSDVPFVLPLRVEAFTTDDNDNTRKPLDEIVVDLVASGFPDNKQQIFALKIPKTVHAQTRYLEIRVGSLLGGKPCFKFLRFA